jgi:hypothetical protein
VSGRVSFGAFDEVSSFEAGSGADEGDEVGCVDGPPPLLGGLDELEDHGEGGGRAAGATSCSCDRVGCSLSAVLRGDLQVPSRWGPATPGFPAQEDSTAEC